jgi:hypothetical protein
MEHHTSDAAIGLALDHMMSINFFFSRYGCSDPSKDADYNFAVEDTGGLELFFRSPLSFKKADSLVRADMDGSTIVSSGGSFGVGGKMNAPPRIDFPVDNSISRIIVVTSAESNYRGISLIDPNGNSAPSPLVMYKGKLWVIENPSNGTWALTSQPNVKGLVFMVNVLRISQV